MDSVRHPPDAPVPQHAPQLPEPMAGDNPGDSSARPMTGQPDPPGPPAPPRTGHWRRVPGPVRWLLYIAAALFLAWLALFLTKGRFLKSSFEAIVSRMLQRDVKVAGDFQLYFDPINIKFRAEGLSIANPEWAKDRPFFRAKTIDTRISLPRLVVGERRARWLTVEEGAIDLRWSPDHQRNTWTFGDPNKKGEPLDLPTIERALLSGTKLHYRDPRMALSVDISFDSIRSRDRNLTSDIRFSGDGSMRARPFVLTGALLSPNETLGGGRNRLELHAASGPTRIDVAGTLPAATQIEGAQLDLVARGPNLRLLFDFLHVAVPDSRAYRITSHLEPVDDEWRFTRIKGRFGDSDLGGRMTISQPGGRLKISADLATQTLDIVDAGPFIGYDPNRIAAQGAKGAIRQVGGTPRILPDAPLRIDALQAFDADVRYTVRRIRAENVPVSNVALTLALNRSLLKLSPLSFDMAGGFVSSDIEINARGNPVRSRYDIRLSPTPMGTLLARWGVEQSGTSGTLRARVQMSGEGDSVRKSLATSDGRIVIVMPAGTMWARNIQLSELDIGTFVQKMFQNKLKDPVQINCGLIAFTVRNGVATADPILIDTRKNVIAGRGGFSFRDESLNLSVRADAKKFSLFSAQSPVGINGYFAAPGINPVSPELLTRAGVGVGLGLFVNPLAGLLAFVDVGDAKSAACGPVLEGARAAAQRTTKGKPRSDVGDGREGRDRRR